MSYLENKVEINPVFIYVLKVNFGGFIIVFSIQSSVYFVSYWSYALIFENDWEFKS